MKQEWVCRYCGKSTFDVDMDYLMGYDHIACLLIVGLPKLENWNKLEGQEFDIMGVPCRMQNAEVDNDIERYTVWVIEKVIGQPLLRVDMYLSDMEIDTKLFVPDSFTTPPSHYRKSITRDHIKNPSIFIQTIGQKMMSDANIRKVLDFLAEHNGSISGRGGMSGGIVSKVMSTGTSVAYSKTVGSVGLNGSAGLFAQTFGSASIW